MHATKKLLYVEPETENLFRLLEGSVDIAGFVFSSRTAEDMTAITQELASEKSSLFISNGYRSAITNNEGKRVGRHFEIRDASDLDMIDFNAFCEEGLEMMLIEPMADSWSIIPLENLIARLSSISLDLKSSHPSPPLIFALVESSDQGRLMLNTLEIGVDGIVLKTDDKAQVNEMINVINSKNAQLNGSQSDKQGLKLQGLELVTVTRVKLIGSGDRACVDLSLLMRPGEGMLVGSFCRGLFLVHSECNENDFISSRPFRVNAGPVHSYIHKDLEGETAYLSELMSGSEVVVVEGKTGLMRQATVGRIKIESRPLILVEAVTTSGDHISIQLQNAETVQLVSLSNDKGEEVPISVCELKVGDKILALVNEGVARHTGIAIKEFLREV